MRCNPRTIVQSWGMAMIIVALSCASAWADVKPPLPLPPREAPVKPVDQDAAVPLVVKLQGDAASAVLEVPTSMLRGAGAAKPRAAGESDATTTTADGGGAMRSIAAGVMLSMAFIAGGLWLARRKGRGGAMGAVMLLGAGLAASLLTVEAMANKAPPPLRPPVPVPTGDPSVKLVPVTDNGRITLILSEKQFEAIAKQINQQKKAVAPAAPGAEPGK